MSLDDYYKRCAEYAAELKPADDEVRAKGPAKFPCIMTFDWSKNCPQESTHYVVNRGEINTRGGCCDRCYAWSAEIHSQRQMQDYFPPMSVEPLP